MFGNGLKQKVLAALFFGNVVNPMVLAFFIWKCCKPNGFSNNIFGNVGKPIILATLCLEML